MVDRGVRVNQRDWPVAEVCEPASGGGVVDSDNERLVGHGVAAVRRLVPVVQQVGDVTGGVGYPGDVQAVTARTQHGDNHGNSR